MRPILNIYLPGRDTQVATINMTDSIYWDEVGNSLTYVKNRLISQEEMLKQASDYAGALPVKNLLPHWESANRFFFTNGNLKVRDGVLYARDSNFLAALGNELISLLCGTHSQRHHSDGCQET